MTSSGLRTFLPITFDINELETWGWCHSRLTFYDLGPNFLTQVGAVLTGHSDV